MKTIKVNEYSEIPESYTGLVEYPNKGLKQWFLNGDFHRENGPAIEYSDGTKVWYEYKKQHREDGPAVEYSDGRREYWLNGTPLEESVIQQFINLGHSFRIAAKLAYLVAINKKEDK